MPKTIKVLSFDLDDTLWPCYPTIKRAEKILYQWLTDNQPIITEQYSAEQLREKRKRLLHQQPEIAHDLSLLRIKSFEQLAEELNLANDWFHTAFNIFYEARQQVTLFDDVKPVLDQLKTDFQLVSVTNGNADADKTGISHWFDYSLNSIGVGKSKSEPDIYQQVHTLANIEPHEMVHIGDDPINDIAGAKSAGCLTVWLNRENKAWVLDSEQPDAEITTLHELSDALEQLDMSILTR